MLNRIALFADDIDQDVTHALDVIESFGLKWVEIRSAWGKNMIDHADKQAREVHALITQRGMKVRCIAAPLLKCKLKGKGEVSQETFNAQTRDSIEQQLAVLRRAIELARLFDTNLVRSFSFWKVGNAPTPIWDELLDPFQPIVRIAEQEGITLAMENDFECNIGTGAWSAKFIKAINSPNFRLLWDPGNAYFDGEAKPYPDGYAQIKNLIAHVHVKDARRNAQGKMEWVALGTGEVDLLGQLRALNADGYHGVIAMENHYTPPNGTKEDGVRDSFKGLQKMIASL